MAVSGAVKPSLPWVASTSGPPARMKTKRRQEGEEGHDTGAGDAGEEQGVGPEHACRPAADEADEGHHHDQRPGRGFAQRQAVDHLRPGQPVVVLDRALVDVGQHRVGAAEGQQRGLGEEPAHLRQRAAGAVQRQQRGHRQQPQQRSRRASTCGQPAAREARVRRRRRVVVDQRRAVARLGAAMAAAERKHLRPAPRAEVADQRRPPARWPGTACRRRRWRRRPRPRCAHIQRFFSARVPMRCAACSTSAVTAGLMP